MRAVLISLATVCVLAGFGCRTAAPIAPVSRVPFGASSTAMLSVGKSLEFEDSLRVTLTEINDSRCKAGVACIWQGELAPVLELSGGDLDVTQTITLGTERTQNVTVVPYTVTLGDATESTVSFSVAKRVE